MIRYTKDEAKESYVKSISKRSLKNFALDKTNRRNLEGENPNFLRYHQNFEDALHESVILI